MKRLSDPMTKKLLSGINSVKNNKGNVCKS